MQNMNLKILSLHEGWNKIVTFLKEMHLIILISFQVGYRECSPKQCFTGLTSQIIILTTDMTVFVLALSLPLKPLILVLYFRLIYALSYCICVCIVQLAKHFIFTLLKYPFISIQPMAAVALEFHPLLYTDFHIAYLLWVTYRYVA